VTSPHGVAIRPASHFRRVELVRVTVAPGRVVAEVTGVLHRYPRTLRVSLATATELVAAGAPLRIDRPAEDLS
jgi:hypothetical protein